MKFLQKHVRILGDKYHLYKPHSRTLPVYLAWKQMCWFPEHGAPPWLYRAQCQTVSITASLEVLDWKQLPDIHFWYIKVPLSNWVLFSILMVSREHCVRLTSKKWKELEKTSILFTHLLGVITNVALEVVHFIRPNHFIK